MFWDDGFERELGGLRKTVLAGV